MKKIGQLKSRRYVRYSDTSECVGWCMIGGMEVLSSGAFYFFFSELLQFKSSLT